MDKHFELLKAEKEIQEAVLRYDTLRLHIARLEQDIFLMNMTQRGLEENIDVLKTTRTIAVASEFKRIKTELESVKNRLVFLRIDRSNHGKMLERVEKLLRELRDKYSAIASIPMGIVIQGKFGKDDGQD